MGVRKAIVVKRKDRCYEGVNISEAGVNEDGGFNVLEDLQTSTWICARVQTDGERECRGAWTNGLEII